MNDFICEPLAARHDRATFQCGVPALDAYLKTAAGQDLRRRAAAVFVMVPRGQPNRIAGFYTLSASSVHLTAIPDVQRKRLARYPQVPAILLGRLARDLSFPGTGRFLLLDALQRSLQHAEEIGAAAIVVDAKDGPAAAFYGKYGFVPILDRPERMFLLMKTVEKLFEADPE